MVYVDITIRKVHSSVIEILSYYKILGSSRDYYKKANLSKFIFPANLIRNQINKVVQRLIFPTNLEMTLVENTFKIFRFQSINSANFMMNYSGFGQHLLFFKLRFLFDWSIWIERSSWCEFMIFFSILHILINTHYFANIESQKSVVHTYVHTSMQILNMRWIFSLAISFFIKTCMAHKDRIFNNILKSWITNIEWTSKIAY